MKKFLFILLFLFSLPLWSRGPAVEPNIGVDSHQDGAPIYKFNFQQKSPTVDTSKRDALSITVIMLFLALPTFVWFFVSQVQHKQNEVEETLSDMEELAQVKNIKDYQKDPSTDKFEKKAS